MGEHPHPAPERITIDEYLTLHGEEYRWTELVNGVITAMDVPITPHSEFQMRLGMLLIAHGLHAGIEGPLQVSRDALGFGTVRELEVYVRRTAEWAHPYLPNDILLAVEVLSENSHQRDYVDKFSEYEKCGIPHYWVVDLAPRPKLTIFRLMRDAGYGEEVTTFAEVDTVVGNVPVRFDLRDIPLPRERTDR
jgi:Uma2 family endonuclease